MYDEGRCKAFVWDISSAALPQDIQPGSIDVIMCVFVLSALDPATFQQAIRHVYTLLKPHGLVLFRGISNHC